MKRILYVANALKPNGGKLDFAIYICKLSNAGLKAIFHIDKEDQPAEASWLSHAAMHAGIPANENTATLKEMLCDRHMHEFKTVCDNQAIPCSVHKANERFLQDVLLESRYADLILLDIEIAFSHGHISIPTSFAEDVLRSAECPVIALPETFNKIEELIFTYDGRISSMYAIKQFTYLFPEFCNIRATVVSINPEIIAVEERYKFLEWLHNSYSDINYYAVEGDERRGLLEILLQRKDVIILMGAYGRSRFSNFFHSSHATNVLRMSGQPVFIIHP